MLDRARDALYLAARKHGGEAEAMRIRDELSVVVREHTNTLTSRMTAYSEAQCFEGLTGMRQGLFDGEHIASAKLKRIGIN